MQQVYPCCGVHQHYRRRKVLILVTDTRIREDRLSSLVTLPENPRNCAASQLRSHQFFDFVTGKPGRPATPPPVVRASNRFPVCLIILIKAFRVGPSGPSLVRQSPE